MKSEDLKVVNLNITEDNYEYKGLFRLCTDENCMDVDLENLSKNEFLEEIKNTFLIEESIEEIKEIINKKVMGATKLESKISQGEGCCGHVKDKKAQRAVDSLSSS